MTRGAASVFRAAVLMLALALTAAGNDGPATYDFGPLLSRQVDVHGHERFKVLGPFFERTSGDDDMELLATRPLYSTVEDPARDRSLDDFVWPVGTSRTVHDENQWRFLIFFGFNHTTNDPGDRYRTWLFPFYFQGRDASGDTYRALFPLGGTIKDFVGRDEVSFVLFPLYSTSALKDISTVNVLWPFISKTTSDNDRIRRGRVFPFYGYNRQEGKFDKQFILWPIYSDVDYYYEGSKGSGHILFPLYGWLNLESEKTLWLLPPFFRFTDGRDKDIVHAPWPFYQRRISDTIDLRYFWPIWGRKTIEQRETHFVLWPFFWKEKDLWPDKRVDTVMAAPFFTHTAVRAVNTNEVVEADAEPKSEVLARRHKLWPLYSYRRDGEDSRFRFVELWPFAEAPAVERNWAPFWTLYERQASGEDVDTEILWGLFRNQKRGEEGRYVSLFPLADYRRGEEEKSWNLLKGLIGYERKASQKSLRLLYFLRLELGKDDPP